MMIFIIIFGTLTCLAGIVIFINPEIIFGFLRKHSDKISLYILAVIIRLVLGSFLICQSNASKYPLTIEIIGWLSIVAALFFSLIGHKNYSLLMAWALSYVKTLGRVGGLLASAFGVFLIHAFV